MSAPEMGSMIRSWFGWRFGKLGTCSSRSDARPCETAGGRSLPADPLTVKSRGHLTSVGCPACCDRRRLALLGVGAGCRGGVPGCRKAVYAVVCGPMEPRSGHLRRSSRRSTKLARCGRVQARQASYHWGTRGLPLLKVSLAYHRRAQRFAPIMSRLKWVRRGVPAVDIELLSLGQRVERAHSSKIRLNSALRTSDRATSAPPANHAWPCPAANRQVNGLRVVAGGHRFAACRLCRSWREMPWWAVRSIQLSLSGNGQLESRSAVKGQRDAQVTV